MGPEVVGPDDGGPRRASGGRLRRSAPALVVAIAVVALATSIAGSARDVAGAVQPYAPRGVELGTRPEGDWLAIDVRAGGFRPNSVVLLDVAGLEQRTAMADASGVVEVSIPLPDRIDVRLRGIALDGGGIDLEEAVVLVRDGGDRGVVVLLAATALGLLLLLGWSLRGGRRRRTVVPAPGEAGTTSTDGA